MTTPLPPSPEDDEASRAAARTIGINLLRWGIPVAAISVLCLWLGVPWWVVGAGIVLFVGFIVFDA